MAQQRIVIFTGTVQGVGFRFTACRVAAGYAVTGSVRNCSDGTVECIVEGDAAEIDAFLADLAERMSGYIHERSEQVAAASGGFTSFGVGY